MLPLEATVGFIVLIGGHADVGVLSGGGSAQVDAPGGSAVASPPSGNNPMAGFMRPQWQPSSPLKALKAALPSANITFNAGDDTNTAVTSAKRSDVAIVFAWQWESEGSDLATLSLAKEQNTLIQA